MKKEPHKWTEEQMQFVKEFHVGVGPTNMAMLVNQRFGLDLNRNQLKALYSKLRLNSGLDGRFVKGHVNVNRDPLAGRRPSQVKTHFKKGSLPHNTLPVGSIVIAKTRDKAYKRIKIADPDVWKFLHIYNWEKEHGPMPAGKTILFLDGNSLNCDIENLRIISRADHSRLNHYQVQRIFNNDETLNACLALVRLKAQIYKRTRGKKEGGKSGGS